jgi:hypothetical protein
MHNVWLVNLRAQPPRVAASVQAAEPEILLACAQAIAEKFPGPEFTLVHEVNSDPLRLPEATL